MCILKNYNNSKQSEDLFQFFLVVVVDLNQKCFYTVHHISSEDCNGTVINNALYGKVCLLELSCTATQDMLSFSSFLVKPHIPLIHDIKLTKTTLTDIYTKKNGKDNCIMIDWVCHMHKQGMITQYIPNIAMTPPTSVAPFKQ